VTVALVTFGLLLANAVFVAAEFAIIGVSRTAIEHRANLGDLLSRRILALLTSPVHQDRFIATAQLGITLASLGLGMYGEHTLAGWIESRLELSPTNRWIAAHTLASVLAIAGLTYLHIFIGEMLPKAIALSHAERTARVLYWPMLGALGVFYPLVRALNGAGNLFLQAIGIPRREGGSDRGYTPEELQIIVEESAEGGAMRAEAGSILSELLEFGDLTAGQVMVPRVRVIGIPAERDVQSDPRRRRQTSPHALPHLRRRPRPHRRHAPCEGSAAADSGRRPDLHGHRPPDAGGARNVHARCRAADDAEGGSASGGRH
jgi:CBS domain containing-hemolysin-like protein